VEVVLGESKNIIAEFMMFNVVGIVAGDIVELPKLPPVDWSKLVELRTRLNEWSVEPELLLCES
tara:strand:+ start:65 stop:256 length:192 start_codon:yes stop_codon:yes gene_type:complete